MHCDIINNNVIKQCQQSTVPDSPFQIEFPSTGVLVGFSCPRYEKLVYGTYNSTVGIAGYTLSLVCCSQDTSSSSVSYSSFSFSSFLSCAFVSPLFPSFFHSSFYIKYTCIYFILQRFQLNRVISNYLVIT